MNMEYFDNNLNKLNKLYDNQTYFDIYGNSVLLFFIITIFVFTVHLYCIVMQNAKAIKDDWVNQRCNPRVMPFVGFINKPEGTSIADFTALNFNYCVQNILVNITGYAVQPFTYLTSALTSVLNSIRNSIKIIREFLGQLRNNFSKMAQNILNRILNIMIPLQQIFVSFKSIIGKTQGILVACLYTSLGTYYTLKSFLGSIVQLIVEILIALTIVIAGLWVLPFTWPVALTMSSVFLAISVPLAIIVVFMTQVLHIQTDGIPKLSSCFDKNTSIKMNDGTSKPIELIEVGDILENNNLVTAKMKLNANNVQMYNINGVIVSESHILKYDGKWIPVKMHPDKILIKEYNEAYIYCLNTNSKEIIINDILFTDWDELYDDSLLKILDTPILTSSGYEKIQIKENIHKYLDYGFEKGTLILKNGVLTPIEEIKVGDFIDDTIVYGIVNILNDTKNIKIDKFSKNINTFDSYQEDLEFTHKRKLFHLLTHTNNFTVDAIKIGDYNSLIDLKLHK